MSRPLLIATVLLASYAFLNIVLSIAVAAAWRFRLARHLGAASTHRAGALLQLRSVPGALAVTITAVATGPAFAIFEPDHASEGAGPVVLLLAAIAIAQLAAATVMALATSLRTRAAARHWLRRSKPLDVDPPAGVPAFAIESPAPIVALVGVFRPRLIAARSVLDACTTSELTAIVAHERGHLHARDNLKRWLMACAPDALRWTPIHHEIAAAWHDAAEDAADDAATGVDAASRVDLAELLLKIARLAPAAAWREATVSPFVEPGGLDRRVRRLLAGNAAASHGARSALQRGAIAAAALAAVSIVVQPAALERLYLAIETVIRFGR
jgi:Zn-dependent protease with chaperone function